MRRACGCGSATSGRTQGSGPSLVSWPFPLLTCSLLSVLRARSRCHGQRDHSAEQAEEERRGRQADMRETANTEVPRALCDLIVSLLIGYEGLRLWRRNRRGEPVAQEAECVAQSRAEIEIEDDQA